MSITTKVSAIRMGDTFPDGIWEGERVTGLTTREDGLVVTVTTASGRVFWAPAKASVSVDRITGYRTNTDGTQTLAWEEREDGMVVCDHRPDRACDSCVEADSRLAIAADGSVVHAYWPANHVREGRTVRFS